MSSKEIEIEIVIDYNPTQENGFINSVRISRCGIEVKPALISYKVSEGLFSTEIIVSISTNTCLCAPRSVPRNVNFLFLVSLQKQKQKIYVPWLSTAKAAQRQERFEVSIVCLCNCVSF